MAFESTLAGKHALVTGGGTGIGFGIARELLRCDCTVTIVGHIAEQIESARERIEKELPGAPLRVQRGDVTVEADLEAAVAAAAGPDGQLDIGVANAGSGSFGPLLLLEKKHWDDLNELNVTGVALTLKHCALAMRRRGGSLVTISSAAGNAVEKQMAPYSTTKAAVQMLTRCAAAELAAFNIRVNCIAPGLVATDAMQSGFSPEIQQQCLDNTLLGRLGTPEEIARGVIYLSSDAGQWITGAVLQIGGGMHVHVGQDFEPLARAVYGDDAIDAVTRPPGD